MNLVLARMVMVAVAVSVSAVACSRESLTNREAGPRSTASVPEDEPEPGKTPAATNKRGPEIVTEPMSKEEKTHQAGHARLAQKSLVESSSPESKLCVATLDLSGPRGFVGGRVDRRAYDRYLRQGPREDVLQCAMEAGKRRTDCRLPMVFSMLVHVNTNGSSSARVRQGYSGGYGGSSDVRVRRDGNGGSEFSRCIQGKVRNWQFPKPEGMAAKFTLPMFVRFRENRDTPTQHRSISPGKANCLWRMPEFRQGTFTH